MKEVLIQTSTVKKFFAKIDGLSRIYGGEKDLALFLWRASRTDEPCENPLHPDFVPREIRKGQFRPADVTIEKRNGVEYIIPKVTKKVLMIYGRLKVHLFLIDQIPLKAKIGNT